MNIVEISEKYPTKESVVTFFEQNRWEGSKCCAYCASTNLSGRASDLRYKCYDCKRTFSVTVGTRLQSTNVELKKWLFAFSIVSDAKKGLSALQLQRNLNISYPTAFKMYHVIRDLMEDFNTEEREETELSGIVEMDETYVGGKPRKFNNGSTNPSQSITKIPELDRQIEELKEEGFSFRRKRGNPAKPKPNAKRGRGTDKTPVVGIVQRNGDVIAEVMKRTTGTELKAMVQKYVDLDDSVLITDEFKGYSRMEAIIEHVKIDHQRLYSYKGVNTNSIESFWAIVKRGVIGQYHQVSDKYLPNYIAEFVLNTTIGRMIRCLKRL